MAGYHRVAAPGTGAGRCVLSNGSASVPVVHVNLVSMAAMDGGTLEVRSTATLAVANVDTERAHDMTTRHTEVDAGSSDGLEALVTSTCRGRGVGGGVDGR